MKKPQIFWTILLIGLLSPLSFSQTPQSNWVDFDGNKIHYYDIGNKKKNALVLIHGWTCSADFWKDSYNAFPEYRVIAVDLIGHGKSDKPKTEYTMDLFARSVDAVMKKAKVKKAVFAGHSMGTPVARAIYRLFHGKTLGIIVVDGSLIPYGDKKQLEPIYNSFRTNYKQTSQQFLDSMLAVIKDAKLKDFIRSNMSATPEHVGLSAMLAFDNDKLWESDQIKRHVLAVMAESPFWKPTIREEFQKIAPDLEFHMWKDISHFLHMEKPAEFNALVKGFIERNKLL